ncbi:GNAT family N-acetyltransferase [Candidatus Heimdallarchaeota archaeon]|nr:MAG: GNAT family N-acetyltransferase [Candidatus Heimdallarchaeota archaeon]
MKFSISHFNDIKKIPKTIIPYLNQKPAINFEAIGILEQLSDNYQSFQGILECIVVSEKEQLKVVTCRIRPYNLLISHSTNIDSISPLVEYFLENNISIPGIYGPTKEVNLFSELWQNLSGEDFQSSDEFLQYSMNARIGESQLIGEISIAQQEHKELLTDWTEKSIREIIPQSTDEFVKACTDSFLKLLELNKVFILEVEKNPVSMAAVSGETKSMLAINDVYTPPEHRGKGYATELCLFLSKYILDDCKKKPILWVKASNHAAIHIYEKIGFEKVAKMALCLKEN